MHLTSTVKSIVFTVAFAAQCVYVKSQNEYGYFDKKFCVLEWITYLKRLSLIALILYGVVLYYVPKSRSHARRTCCILIDTVANGLKFALNTNETEHENIKDENNPNKEIKVRELYRKVYKEDTGATRKHKSKKLRAKYSVNGKHERHRRNNNHRNATNNVWPESNAVIANNSSEQIINEKCEKDNMIVLQETSPKTRSTMRTMLAEKLKNNTDSQQKDSLNKETDSNIVSEIIDKNNTKKFKALTQKQQDVSDADINKKLQTKQNYHLMKHEEVTLAFPRQSNKDCTRRITNKHIDTHYEKLLMKRELYDGKENHRFLHDIKSFSHDCYENSLIIKNRAKPILLRVVNWFFGGCPEASRRHREQVDEVGKEEIFESTNTWLL